MLENKFVFLISVIVFALRSRYYSCEIYHLLFLSSLLEFHCKVDIPVNVGGFGEH